MQARKAALLTLVFVGVLFESFPALAQVVPMPNRSGQDSGVDVRTHKFRPRISPDLAAVDASDAAVKSAAAIGPSAARQMTSLLQDKRSRTAALRTKLMQNLIDYFPDEIRLARGKNKCLIFEDGAKVVIRMCRSFTIKSGRRWMLGGCDGSSITLAATMNKQNTDVGDLYLLPAVPKGRYWLAESALLDRGVRLNGLADFCDAVRVAKDRQISD
jgi:hypothetical protein